jgi:hypothetical protein
MAVTTVETLLRAPGLGDDGGRLSLAAKRESAPDGGAVPIVPGGLDEHAPGVAVAGFGERAPALRVTGGVLARYQAEVGHELAGPAEAGEVDDLPKVTAVDGVTPKSTSATPLAALEQALSFPARSTAVTRAKYVVFAARPTIRWLTVVPAAGARAGEDTE